MDRALEDALLWHRYASEDLQTARALVDAPEAVSRHPAWLAQQAAEKALKAVLIADRVPFPRTRNLVALSKLISPGSQVAGVVVDLERLTEYAVEARYPGDLPDVTREDARVAVEEAAVVVDAVHRELNVRLRRM